MASRPVIALFGLRMGAETGFGDYLERRGYDVRSACEDWEAEAVLDSTPVDIAVVDMQTTGDWGVGMLVRTTAAGAPAFVMIGANSGMIDRVLALEMGASDFVDAPFNTRELATRIAGLLARRGRVVQNVVVLERSTVDLKAALVMHRSGAEEQLSPGQIALFRLFVESPYKVLGRDDIIAAAPAEDSDAFDRSINSRIVRLRRKLDTDCIVTVRGAGYRYDPPQGADAD